MKKFIAIVLCVATILAIMPTAAFAYQPQPAKVMAVQLNQAKQTTTSDTSAKEFFTVLGENILVLLETPVSIIITLIFLPQTIVENIRDAIKYR